MGQAQQDLPVIELPQAVRNAKARSWKQINPEKARAWNKANKEKMNAYGRKFYYANLEKDTNKKLITRYGISIEEYNEMFLSQDGKCKICGLHQASMGRRLSIDHDHDTGAVRGLLCANCNGGLGNFKDKEEVLRIAADYLASAKKEKTI